MFKIISTTINKSEFSKGGGSNQLYIFTERKIIIERNAQIANLINSKNLESN